VALLGIAWNALAVEPPFAPFSAEYEVSRNGSVLGRGTVELHPVEGPTWELVTHTKGTQGLAALAGAEIVEQSEFTWHDGRPELLQYRYRQDVAWKTRERSLVADRAAGTIHSRDRDEERVLTFEPGVIDRHLVVVALGIDLRDGREDLRYLVANRGEVEWNRYRIAGEESIDTPDGPRRAIKVERIRDNKDRTTTVWIAPDLGWIPARTLQTEPDGETLDMRLLRVRR
jgi:hypothetical protein